MQLHRCHWPFRDSTTPFARRCTFFVLMSGKPEESNGKCVSSGGVGRKA